MKNTFALSGLVSVVLCAVASSPATAYPRATDPVAPSFVNWETPHVHPLDITPDGKKLLAVNTADNRLAVFDISGSASAPVLKADVPVGLDPVSVRARTNGEAWVVNGISDNISIVDLATWNVVATLPACDEPADVVFAGHPVRAFVSCAQESKLLVFDPLAPSAPPTVLAVEGEEPRALAVSPDGSTVYVAIFESGNGTTILGSHGEGSIVGLPEGPYAGQNPPPNRGTAFFPPINPSLPVPPPTMGLIVKNDGRGHWLDDNIGDWTPWISGEFAGQSGRETGWDVVDNDVAIVDTATLSIRYLTGLMNLNMSVGVRPDDGKVTVVGTSALNHVRYVPNLKGRFVRVDLAIVDAALPDAARVVDLNPHLTYSDDEIAVQSDPATFSQALRDESVGDPRAILWSRGGDLGYVAGMGSNNVAVIDRNGARVGSPLVVGEGPTGLAIHGSRLYVMNKFEASVSVVNTETKKTVATVALYDPTPQAVKDGRKFQYDTHRTSALGQIACASCHVDSRIDRIAWDLGDPTGQMVPFGQNCNYDVVIKPQDECHDFHPMKGPMLTQTLQDIIGREPFHWRGDKFGIEDFNPAFTGLQGHEVQLTPEEMQQYREFLATIAIPPNPNRNPDNSLPTLLPLPGQYSSGEFVKDGGLARGTPMPPGDAQVGEESFRLDIQHGNGPGLTATCRMCHTFPLGSGADVRFVGDVDKFPLGEGVFEPMPVGEEGEHYLMTSTLSFAGEDRTFKVPQLRALYKRVGFERTQMRSLSGFGFFHDGGESLESFVSRFKNMTSDQQVANFIAFLMSFSGSDLPEGSLENLLEPPGPASQDTHASVGKQVTFHGAGDTDPGAIALLASWEALADAGKVGLVAKGLRSGVARGYTYVGGGVYQSDHVGELARGRDLRTQTSHGSEMTFLVVPYGSETRIGIDRDEDGILDGDDAVLTPHRVSVVRAPRAVPISPRLSSAAH